MTIIAQPYAGPQVHILVNNLNRMLFELPVFSTLKVGRALMASPMAPWHKSAEAAPEGPSRQAQHPAHETGQDQEPAQPPEGRGHSPILPGGAAAV